MTTDVSWRTLAKPLGHWMLKRLPKFIFVHFYDTDDLEHDIKIRLRAARLGTVKLLRGLHAPYLEIELELFNLSPYLDARITAVRSSVSACDEEGLGHTFAHMDDWGAFELLRGVPRPLHLRYWPNEYQTAILSTYSEEHFPLKLLVVLCVDSPIGVVYPFKALELPGLAGR